MKKSTKISQTKKSIEEQEIRKEIENVFKNFDELDNSEQINYMINLIK